MLQAKAIQGVPLQQLHGIRREILADVPQPTVDVGVAFAEAAFALLISVEGFERCVHAGQLAGQIDGVAFLSFGLLTEDEAPFAEVFFVGGGFFDGRKAYGAKVRERNDRSWVGPFGGGPMLG